eukprot:363937-Chlamydomonas_euryale.AAC.9
MNPMRRSTWVDPCSSSGQRSTFSRYGICRSSLCAGLGRGWLIGMPGRTCLSSLTYNIYVHASQSVAGERSTVQRSAVERVPHHRDVIGRVLPVQAMVRAGPGTLALPGSGGKVAGDGGGAVSADQMDQIKKLKLQVQQRDNEINILVSMLQRRDGGTGRPSGPQLLQGAAGSPLARSSAATALPSPPGHQPGTASPAASGGGGAGAANADDLAALMNTDMLGDRNKAFELFRKSYRQNEVIEENKVRNAPYVMVYTSATLCRSAVCMACSSATVRSVHGGTEVLLGAIALALACPASSASSATCLQTVLMPQLRRTLQALLKQKYDAAKAVGQEVNDSKGRITELKTLIEQRRVQRIMAGEESADDPEEERCKDLIEEEKRRYKVWHQISA